MIASVITNTLRGVLYPIGLARRATMVPKNSWIDVTLDGTVTELERPLKRLVRLGEAIAQRGRSPRPAITVAEVRTLVDTVISDPNVSGVLVRIEPLECGWAIANSLRDELSRLRSAGKSLAAWLPEGASTREIYIALAADKIFAPPQASIAPLGVAARATFVRGLLAKAGLEAEIIQRKEYKSAGETFTRDGWSEPNQRQLDALLDSFHNALVQAITDSRGVDRDRAKAIIDVGPMRATDAVREGLIDATAYDDELRTRLGLTANAKLTKAQPYRALSALLNFKPRGHNRRVGVVMVRGTILSSSTTPLGEIADARKVTAALRAARDNDTLGAVVLYVDSRGGSVLGSDLIAREVERLREKKPVVAYFGDVAASGGYYVSALCDEIVAQPGTVTGSIGVISMRFIAVELLDKLGLTHQTRLRGARVDMMSPYRRWSDEDRAVLDREIDGFYTDFVSIVARGRRKTVDEIEPLAHGRIYAAVDAKDLGLVDRLGGLDVALERARSIAGGDFDREPVVVSPPKKTPAAAETPPPVKAALTLLAGHARAELDLVSLALDATREHLFAWDDRQFW